MRLQAQYSETGTANDCTKYSTIFLIPDTRDSNLTKTVAIDAERFLLQFEARSNLPKTFSS